MPDRDPARSCPFRPVADLGPLEAPLVSATPAQSRILPLQAAHPHEQQTYLALCRPHNGRHRTVTCRPAAQRNRCVRRVVHGRVGLQGLLRRGLRFETRGRSLPVQIRLLPNLLSRQVAARLHDLDLPEHHFVGCDGALPSVHVHCDIEGGDWRRGPRVQYRECTVPDLPDVQGLGGGVKSH